MAIFGRTNWCYKETAVAVVWPTYTPQMVNQPYMTNLYSRRWPIRPKHTFAVKREGVIKICICTQTVKVILKIRSKQCSRVQRNSVVKNIVTIFWSHKNELIATVNSLHLFHELLCHFLNLRINWPHNRENISPPMSACFVLKTWELKICLLPVFELI
jgi:hypothetical protein